MFLDDEQVLKAFAQRWSEREPHLVYNVVREDELRSRTNLPPERFRNALLRLLDQGILARRGALRPPSDGNWTYQFTMEGLELAREMGYLDPRLARAALE